MRQKRLPASGSRLPAEQTICRGIVGSDNGKTQILGYLVDSVLANNGNPAGGGKSGYQFTSGTGTVFGTVNSGCTALAKPKAANQTGIRAFCGEEDGVVRVDPAGACSSAEATIPDIQPAQPAIASLIWRSLRERVQAIRAASFGLLPFFLLLHHIYADGFGYCIEG
jgi:hypothetical protein